MPPVGAHRCTPKAIQLASCASGTRVEILPDSHFNWSCILVQEWVGERPMSPLIVSDRGPDGLCLGLPPQYSFVMWTMLAGKQDLNESCHTEEWGTASRLPRYTCEVHLQGIEGDDHSREVMLEAANHSWSMIGHMWWFPRSFWSKMKGKALAWLVPGCLRSKSIVVNESALSAMKPGLSPVVNGSMKWALWRNGRSHTVNKPGALKILVSSWGTTTGSHSSERCIKNPLLIRSSFGENMDRANP